MRLAYWRAVFGVRQWTARTLARLAGRPGKPPKRLLSGALPYRPQAHPGYDLDPEDIPQIYRKAEAGDPRMQVALFDDLLERDPNTRNLFEQRALAVAGKPWSLMANGTGRAAERAQAVLNAALRDLPWFADAITHWLSSNCYGYAASEIEWGTKRINGRLYVVPVAFHHLHPDHFRIATGHARPQGALEDELLLVTTDSPQGERLLPGQWVVMGRPGTMRLSRRGLMRVCAWFSAFKLFTSKNWIAFVLRYGIPFSLAKIPQHQDEDSRRVAEEMIEALGEDGGAVIPEGLEVELKDGARMDSSLHRDLVQWCDAQNSKAVYGATLANDNGGGSSSYALGSLHGQVRWENVVGDTVRVQETFSACIAEPFVRFNGWDVPPPRLRLHVVRSLSPLELVQVADYLRNRLGVPISTEQVRHMLGFLAPVDASDAVPGLAGGSGAPVPPSAAGLSARMRELSLHEAMDIIETALATPAHQRKGASASGALGGALSL